MGRLRPAVTDKNRPKLMVAHDNKCTHRVTLLIHYGLSSPGLLFNLADQHNVADGLQIQVRGRPRAPSRLQHLIEPPFVHKSL